MKIYLDNCCFNRLFDNRTDSRIYYERNSTLLILELVEKKHINLIGSNMITKEIEDTLDIERLAILSY